MEKKLLKAILAILFLFPVYAYSVDITFTSSGTITDGNVYDWVSVRNDGTIVDMSGGRIFYSLYTYDSSTFNISGGLIKWNPIHRASIMIGDLSTINISGGTIEADFGLWGSADISGGNVTGSLKANPGTVFDITGGNLNFGTFDIHGLLNIFGGLLNVDYAYISNESTVNIFGYGFNYDPVGQILTGYLLDNNSFTINHLNNLDYQHLNLIPEPVSIFLFGISLLTICLRRTSKKI